MEFLAFFESGLPAGLVWGLVPRVLGVLYVIAFASLIPQIIGLVGRGGISPVHARLERMREDFPGPRRFFALPTLLWLGASDRHLRMLVWSGLLAGCVAVYGGPAGQVALWACWGLLLSLDVAGLMFPWDCLLYEAGFLGLMLPAVPGLDVSLSTDALPLPALAFMWRLLIVRLMWGFAKLKFIGTRRGDSMYLRGFLTWMPMTTPLGWRLQHAPRWVLRGAYAFMWVVEVVAPLLGLFAGAPRVVAGGLLMSLMAGIAATGNWGFFNIGYGALCIVLFDAHSSLGDIASWSSLWATPSAALTHVVLSVVAFGSLLYFAFNSWCSQTWIHWPFEDLTYGRPWLEGIIRFFRALAPFRVVNAYGVFPPNASPPLKLIPVFQGSDDGETWQDFRFKFMPTQPDSRPPVVAPHHPRVDHLIVYAGSGMDDANYLASLLGGGKPYGFSSFSHASWMQRLAQRLLEGSPATRGLLARDNPFAAAPPRHVRVVGHALTPTPLRAWRETGAWWEVRPTALLMPPTQLDPLLWKHWLPPPELFHPDNVHHRKRAPALVSMLRAFASGQPHTQAVRVASDISSGDVEAFWGELIPLLGTRDREDWSVLADDVRALRARFGRDRMFTFERILERYAFLLRMVLEPYFYGEATPRIKKRSNFRFHLLLHELVLDGRGAYERALAHPDTVAERAARQTDASSLYAAAVFRHEMLRYHATSMRLSGALSDATLPSLPGILEFQELLRAYAASFDRVWVPRCEQRSNGEWYIDSMGPSREELGGGADAEPCTAGRSRGLSARPAGATFSLGRRPWRYRRGKHETCHFVLRTALLQHNAIARSRSCEGAQGSGAQYAEVLHRRGPGEPHPVLSLQGAE